jgi:hypothetical protein
MRTLFLNGLGGTENLARLERGASILVQRSSRWGYFTDNATFLGLSLNGTGQAVLSYQISFNGKETNKEINLDTLTGELGVYSWAQGAD